VFKREREAHKSNATDEKAYSDRRRWSIYILSQAESPNEMKTPKNPFLKFFEPQFNSNKTRNLFNRNNHFSS